MRFIYCGSYTHVLCACFCGLECVERRGDRLLHTRGWGESAGTKERRGVINRVESSVVMHVVHTTPVYYY